MLIRYLMIFCLLLLTAMPMHVSASEAPIDIPKEYRQNVYHIEQGIAPFVYTSASEAYKKYPTQQEQAPYPDSPLSKLQITTEHWTENNTLFIHYTITNTTDTTITEDIDHIRIEYTVYPKTKNCLHQAQYTNALRKLYLPARSSCTFVATLPISEPFEFLHLNRSTFFLSDFSSIVHTLGHTNTIPNTLMTPIFLPSGEVYIAIKNHHFFKTITDIRDIMVKSDFGSKRDPNSYFPFYYADNTRLPIRLKPQETIFYRLPISFAEMNDDVHLLSVPNTQIKATIDGTVHVFEPKQNVFFANTITNHTVKYQPSPLKCTSPFIEATGIYEVTATAIEGYIRIKNITSAPIYTHRLRLATDILGYRTDNSFDYATHSYISTFPQKQIKLSSGEEAFLSFTIPLSDSIKKASHIKSTELYSDDDLIYFNIPFVKKQLSPLQKSLYTPATITRSIHEEVLYYLETRYKEHYRPEQEKNP